MHTGGANYRINDDIGQKVIDLPDSDMDSSDEDDEADEGDEASSSSSGDEIHLVNDDRFDQNGNLIPKER